MSFSGCLADMPVADVIQILHASRKTGKLHLDGDGGSVVVALEEGDIVAASHSRSDVDIGLVLKELGAVDDRQLEEGLDRQLDAGAGRRPLVATMVAMGCLSPEEGRHGLETLVRRVLLDVVGWRDGRFLFEAGSIQMDDGFRLSPTDLPGIARVDTEKILADVLQLFEARRSTGRAVTERAAGAEPSGGAGISPDDGAAAASHDGGDGESAADLRDLCAGLRRIRARRRETDVSLVALDFVARRLERCVLFLVRGSLLQAVAAFGVEGCPDTLSIAGMGLNLPWPRSAVLSRVVREGVIYQGGEDDPAPRLHLYAALGVPRSPDHVWIPLQVAGRTVAVIHGDFGGGEPRPVSIDAMEILAGLTGLAYEVALREREASPGA